MFYSTRASLIKIDEHIRIYFTEKKYKSEVNPLGIVPGRFDLTPTTGVYKAGKNQDSIRWFFVKMVPLDEGYEFTAKEVSIDYVYMLLKDHGKWLQPDSMNAARSNKYRPVYEWLKANRSVKFKIMCENCGNTQLIDKAKWINVKISQDVISCPCGNQLELDIKGDDD